MRNKLRSVTDGLFSSYWFVPTVMTLCSAVLAVLMIRLDQGLDLETFRSLGFVYFNEPDGARALVSTVASSMITVAGTTFSITLAVLSLTSGQFGPRLLSSFMRDTGNQVVLGTFVSTYIYCLLVLRTIHGDDTFSGEAFVPHLSVILAILFALASLGVFIYFIHHTAQVIQASNITTRIAGDLTSLIDKLYPEAKHGEERTLHPRPGGEGTLLVTPKSSYLQGIEASGLVAFADKHDVVLEVLHEAGEFLLAGQPLVRVWGALDERQHKTILRNLTLGSRRTPARDLDFLFDQLSEMALRALSPSTNDAVTAMRCTDRIAQGLKDLSSRERSTQHQGEGGVLRLLLPELELAHIVSNSFGETRRFSADNMLYSMHLLSTIGNLLALTDDAKLHRVLLKEARLVREGAKEVLLDEDFERLSGHYLEITRDNQKGEERRSAGATQ